MYFVRMADNELLDKASGGPQDRPATNIAAKIVSVTIELFTRFKPPAGICSCMGTVSQ